MLDTLRAVLIVGAAVAFFFGTRYGVLATTVGYRGENEPFADIATLKSVLCYLVAATQVVFAARISHRTK